MDVGIKPVARSVWSLMTPARVPLREPTVSNLAYRERPFPRGVKPRVDVYLPSPQRAAQPLPSVVLVHGGAFAIGSKTMKPVRTLATELVEAGFAVAAIDYRLLLRGGKIDGCEDDVRAALGWWGQQSERFGLDPRSTYLVGLSAGATLSILASHAPPIPLKRVVSIFALYDLGALGGRLPALLGKLLVGGPRGGWTAASPCSRPVSEAPLTILHGDADSLTPVDQARDYARRRDELGLETELFVYPGADHGFFNDAESEVARTATRDLLGALRERELSASS